MRGSQPAPRVLSLYPRRYRAEHGDEITQLYRDATEGANAHARRREDWDIAAHALRVRTALASHQPLGRFTLTAAPYALAAAASIAASRVAATAADGIRDEDTASLPGLDGLLPGMGGLMVCLATLAAGALACAGRWPRARALSAPAVVLLVAQVHASAWLLPLLAVVVLMPSGAEPARTDRRLALVLAALTWLPTFPIALPVISTLGAGMIGQLGPVLAVLVWRTAVQGCTTHHVPAVLFAGLPWITTPTASPIGLGIVTAALTLAWCVGRTAGTRLAGKGGGRPRV
ncbi:hypothetical protein [Streptomyces sp. PU-14G]|uniref:hypothetical protein n=1 Tax=Streptomyces sp. PU-14G TaxID=2800808 RepID=UPI0034DE2848